MGNDNKKHEEMSLAELLGGGSPTAPVAPPERVDQREDEAGSGMINLSQMVMTATAPKPKPEPVVPKTDPFAASASNWGQPAAGSDSEAPGRYAPPVAQKKSNTVMIVGIAVAAVVVVGVGLFLALGGKEEKDTSAEVAALQAQLAAALEKAKQSGDAAEVERLQAQVDATADAEKPAEESMEFSEDEAGSEKAGTTRRTGRASAGAKQAKDASATAAASTEPARTEEKAPVKEEAKAPAATATPGNPKGSSAAIDGLLGTATKAPTSTSGVPAKPSKEQVAAAMAPVVSKSQSTCAQWGKGKITIRVIVGGNGRVRDAIPLGDAATNPAGRCVAKVALTAKFPPFSDPTLTFSYPITLQ